MTTLPRLILGLLQLVLWAALLGFVALLVLPRVSAYDVLIVRGGSMEPSIHVGSIVVVDRGSRSPTVGTPTAFRDGNGAMVTHRVIAIDDAGYETRGDSNAEADLGRRNQDQVYGTVVVSIPVLGYALHLLHQPSVFRRLLLGTGGVLIVGELRTIRHEVSGQGRHRKATDEG